MPGGRKPKPAHLKLIEGNAGKRPLPTKKVKISSKIRMPNGMSPEEKRVWKYMLAHLPTGMVKVADVISLRTYCEAVAEYDMAGAKLKSGYLVKAKSGAARLSPWVRVRKEAWDRMHKLSAEFGFTPSARTKLDILDVADDDDEDGDGFFS